MKIFVLAKKELIELYRETSGFLFMFLMPAALLVVFNLTLGGAYNVGGSKDRPIRITIVNLDQGPSGQVLVNNLDSLAWIRTETTTSEDEPLTEEIVREAVMEGRRSSAVVIPADFSSKLRSTEGKPEVRILVDPGIPSQFIGPIEGAIAGALSAVQFGFDMSRFSQEALPAKLIREPVQQQPVEEEYIFPTVYQQNLSGYSVMSIFFLIMSIGSAFISERDIGTFTRILAAPMKKSTYLAGKLMPYLFIAVLQVAFLIILSIVLYQTPIGNDLLALVVITLCTAASSCGLGLLMVTLFNKRGQFEGIAIVIILILTAFSGSFVPRFVLPEAVQQASLFIPQSWSLLAYQDVMVRNLGLMDVLPNCGMLLLFTGLFFAIGVWRFKFE